MTASQLIDKEAIRAKYAEEREKRLRADGADQYLRLAGTSLAHYVDDPYMPVVEREPVTDHVDVALVGGGLCGADHWRAPQGGGGREDPHHRQDGRLRRKLVLEPLPRRAVRHGVLRLYPSP